MANDKFGDLRFAIGQTLNEMNVKCSFHFLFLLFIAFFSYLVKPCIKTVSLLGTLCWHFLIASVLLKIWPISYCDVVIMVIIQSLNILDSSWSSNNSIIRFRGIGYVSWFVCRTFLRKMYSSICTPAFPAQQIIWPFLKSGISFEERPVSVLVAVDLFQRLFWIWLFHHFPTAL